MQKKTTFSKESKDEKIDFYIYIYINDDMAEFTV